MEDDAPGAVLNDSLDVAGYAFSQTLGQVLLQAGTDLTRENIMK